MKLTVKTQIEKPSYRKTRAGRAAPHPGSKPQGMCRRCGKVEIYGVTAAKRYCPECLKKNAQENDAFHYHAPTKSTGMKWLDDMNAILAEAKRRGMSYAEYQKTERKNHMDLKTLIDDIHENAIAHGWWEKPETVCREYRFNT